MILQKDQCLTHTRLSQMNWDEIRYLRDEGYITVNKHTEEDIWILSYTQKTVADNYWTPYTIECRGVVINSYGDIISRPFLKFFNYEEHNWLPNEEFEIFDKADGSLGILFYYQNKWIISTRGSFISDQSNEAYLIAKEKELDFNKLDKNYTYLFEIIYPLNKIVIDYGTLRDLFFLGAIHTKNCTELNLSEIKKMLPNASFVKSYGFKESSNVKELFKNEIQKEDKINEEGRIIRFKSGARVKIKYETYLILHKSISNLTPLYIWELLSTGKNDYEVLALFPDEFHYIVNQYLNELKELHLNCMNVVYMEFEKIKKMMGDNFKKEDKKSFAVIVNQIGQLQYNLSKNILFSYFDGKYDVVEKIIWKHIRPNNNFINI